jgi:hypothetical protein
MHRFMPKLSFATPLVAICLTVASSAAIAQNSRVDQAGHTSVALSAGFVAALGDLDVTPGTIYPTELEDGKVSFPITSGVLDLDTAKLQLLHSGGLTFKAGSTKVTLSSFIIDDTASAPAISGLVTVDGTLLGRLPLFDLVLPSDIELPLKPVDGLVKLSGVAVNLDPAAAAALNRVFKVKAFKGGFNIGIASVAAYVPTHTN